MNTQQHTYRHFDVDLAALRSAVAEMGALAARQFRRAAEAVATGDLQAAADVIAQERVLDDLHMRVDADCNRLIARHQPAAVDLREVIGVIHTINDLERVGDEAKKVALKVRDLDLRGLDVPLRGVAHMAAAAGDMLDRAVDAFARHDASVADSLARADDEVDRMRTERIGDLVERMARDPGRIAGLLELVLVVQAIERVADHAENIAEYVVNVVEGVDVRHRRRPPE